MGIKREHFFPRAQFTIDLISNLLKYNKEKLHASKSGLPLICDKFLAKHRANEGEVFFILGSGESINSISSKQWSFIKSQRSIGLNHWMCHWFVPDFYMIEGLQSHLKAPAMEKLKVWRDNNLQRYFTENKTIITLLKDLRKSYFSEDFLVYMKSHNSFAIPKFSIPGRDNFLREKNIKILSRYNVLRKFPFFSVASITLAISFANLLNFKKIVLCGVDLNNGKYFWENESFSPSYISLPPSYQNPKVHPTVNRNISPITVDQSLYAIEKFFLRPNGINLTVLSERSKLYPKISKYIPS